MKLKSRDQQLLQRVRYRDRIIIGLFALLALSTVGLAVSPHQIDVYQPPDLRYGHLSKAGVVPDTAVYSFTEGIIDALFTWTKDGKIDYKKNREALSAFFTPTFKRWLKNDYETRLNSKPSELTGRVAYVSVIPGVNFTAKHVVPHNNNTWTVYLDRRVHEYLDDRLVKTVDYRFPIKLVRWKVSRTYNPWQLAIDGFDGEITRIEVTPDDKVATEKETSS